MIGFNVHLTQYLTKHYSVKLLRIGITVLWAHFHVVIVPVKRNWVHQHRAKLSPVYSIIWLAEHFHVVGRGTKYTGDIFVLLSSMQVRMWLLSTYSFWMLHDLMKFLSWDQRKFESNSQNYEDFGSSLNYKNNIKILV